MESKKLLIVGIDPGMTAAYAALDIEGKFLAANSSKQLELNSIISEVIKLGKVVMVGTDKAKIPGLVGAFAAKLGARVVSPSEDLKVEEKRRTTSSFNLNDEHQADALAAAIFAYKETKALRDKIDFFVKENKKDGISGKLKELVITRRISISNAAKIIEAKEEDEEIIENVISERKLTENDFLKLYNKLKRYEHEAKIAKKYNDSLRNRISKIEKSKDANAKAENKKTYDFRENKIRLLDSLVQSRNKEISMLTSQISKLENIFSNIGNFYILKKLGTLSANELEFKNKILNVQRNDMLLVDNPNIASEKAVGFLKDRVFAIVHNKPIGKNIENRLPFIFISSRNLEIEETSHFAFVEKKRFEIEKNKINWAGKIIEDYKREKELFH